MLKHFFKHNIARGEKFYQNLTDMSSTSGEIEYSTRTSRTSARSECDTFHGNNMTFGFGETVSH